MTNNKILSILNEICKLIDQNLRFILGNRHEIKWKSDDSPVTTSDIFIENLVCNYLSSRINGIKFISEESHNVKSISTAGYIAILDPIDGTENFCSGLKEWGISLGLWQNGIYAGGFLLMPELNERLINGEKIHQYHSRITGVSSTFNNAVLNVLNGSGEYRVMGCAVYNILNVIRGSYKRFINPKGVPIWDFLPGVMLALEHGCRVKINENTYMGEFLQPNKKYRVDIRK